MPNLTTFDEIVDFPAWYPFDEIESLKTAENYVRIRYSKPVKEFMAQLEKTDVDLRRIIQLADISADFVIRHTSAK